MRGVAGECALIGLVPIDCRHTIAEALQTTCELTAQGADLEDRATREPELAELVHELIDADDTLFEERRKIIATEVARALIHPAWIVGGQQLNKPVRLVNGEPADRVVPHHVGRHRERSAPALERSDLVDVD